MAMNATPTTTLEVIQPELLFCLAKTVFDWPASECHPKDLSKRPTAATGDTVGQKVLRFPSQHIAGNDECALVADQLVRVSLAPAWVPLNFPDVTTTLTV